MGVAILYTAPRRRGDIWRSYQQNSGRYKSHIPESREYNMTGFLRFLSAYRQFKCSS